MRFRTKSIYVDAIQFDSPATVPRIVEWSGGRVHPHYGDPVPERPSFLVIDRDASQDWGFFALNMTVNRGDWVILHSTGKFSTCAPDVFTGMYELLS